MEKNRIKGITIDLNIDNNKMNKESAYVYLDLINNQLLDDNAPDRFIVAIEVAKELLREKITGYSE